jgi:hypothetical protein
MRSRFLLYAGMAAVAAARPVTLVENSAAKAAIVVAGNASADERFAAEELSRYIRKATGAQLAVTASPAAGAAKVFVGPHACPPAVTARLRRIGGDGWLIETEPDGSLVLAGNGRDGTSMAVYQFLQRFAGVRWLWPGALGEVVPAATSLTVADISLQQAPAYVWRDLGPGGALWGPMDKLTAERKLGVPEPHQETEQLWEKRNGFGGLLIYGGHAMNEILPPDKYGPTHPEYYALVNGKRNWEHADGKHGAQPDTTNPDVIRIVADYADHFFSQHPGYDAFAISLNDGGGFCECDRCRRLDSGATATQSADPELGGGGKTRVITDRILTFANEVADIVAKKHPNKKLILFAYGPYKQPPTHVKPRPNVIIQYTYHASLDWSPKAQEQQFAETGAWSGVAKDLGVYEYFIQGNSPDIPRLMPEPIAQSVRKLYEQGYRYYQTQAGDGYAVNGLNYYVLGRLLWDPTADVQRIQSEFVEAGFGKATPAVNRYLTRLEDQWKAQNGKPVAMDAPTESQYRRVAEAYPPEFRAACRADLEEAYGLASGVARERVQFLQKGLEYVDLTVAAVEKTLPLFQAGWKFAPSVAAPEQPDMAAFRQALAAWDQRGRYAESLKDDFVIAYFWVRYNDENRTFVPLRKMQEFAAQHASAAGH